MSIKILSFNICCSGNREGHSLPERAPRVISVIDKYDPDLIGFQEVTPRWIELLGQYFEDKGYEVFNKYRGENDRESTPMLWKKDRFECLDKGYFWLSDTPEVESRGWDTLNHPRICMWAKLKDLTTGQVFVYANTHFGFSDLCHSESAHLVLDRVSSHNTDSVFVTADYNFYKDSVGYKEMTKLFVDVTAVTTGDKSATFHNYDPANALTDDELKTSGKTYGGHIDFCFANPNGIIPISGKVYRDHFDGKFPSDHNPVLFELDVK